MAGVNTLAASSNACSCSRLLPQSNRCSSVGAMCAARSYSGSAPAKLPARSSTLPSRLWSSAFSVGGHHRRDLRPRFREFAQFEAARAQGRGRRRSGPDRWRARVPGEAGPPAACAAAPGTTRADTAPRSCPDAGGPLPTTVRSVAAAELRLEPRVGSGAGGCGDSRSCQHDEHEREQQLFSTLKSQVSALSARR